MEEFLIFLDSRKKEFENFLKETIYPEIQKNFHPKLAEACIYSLSAGGKRIRPILALQAFYSHQDSKSAREIFFLAAALECIHTYSLIHDDLPSMDDDDFRRGIPTLHKKFSESTAILAGDALNSYAFSLIAKVQSEKDYSLTSDLLNILHIGSGGSGMIAGQIEDLELENNPSLFTESALHSIHQKKTGALILASLVLGNRLHSDYQSKEKIFKTYGEGLGLLFQITDDIIDTEGSFEEIGKTPGKDLVKGKLTYISLYGIEKSKALRDQIKFQLIELGIELDKNSQPFFKFLPEFIAERKK